MTGNLFYNFTFVMGKQQIPTMCVSGKGVVTATGEMIQGQEDAPVCVCYTLLQLFLTPERDRKLVQNLKQ